MLRDPQYNKGLAFTPKERDAHYLRGLLPPAVSTQELQVTFMTYIPVHKFLFFCIVKCYGSLHVEIKFKVVHLLLTFLFFPCECIKQERKLMNNIRQYQVPLQKYMALMELQVAAYPLFITSTFY